MPQLLQRDDPPSISWSTTLCVVAWSRILHHHCNQQHLRLLKVEIYWSTYSINTWLSHNHTVINNTWDYWMLKYTEVHTVSTDGFHTKDIRCTKGPHPMTKTMINTWTKTNTKTDTKTRSFRECRKMSFAIQQQLVVTGGVFSSSSESGPGSGG